MRRNKKSKKDLSYTIASLDQIYIYSKKRVYMLMYPFLVEKPWGGLFISESFNLLPRLPLGEAFIVSTLEGAESFVGSEKLSEHLSGHLPYLIKVIDASDNLSIQVHPDDKWASVLERSVGKTECWLVLDADEGSGIYYGLKPNTSFSDLEKTINDGADASACLNFYQVKRGDFINVPAGTIHAIGKGVRILEFQQSSGITYRIWDWGRKGRELHLEKAKLVTKQTQQIGEFKNFVYFKDHEVFYEHEDFALKKTGEDKIICFSNKVDTKFEIDVTNFNSRII